MHELVKSLVKKEINLAQFTQKRDKLLQTARKMHREEVVNSFTKGQLDIIEVSTGAVGTYQTLEASGIYYFQKGEVLKPCVQIWGASGDVSTVFTQSPGGTGEGIYNCVEMYQILL